LAVLNLPTGLAHSPPPLGWLLAGFAVLAAGLAILTRWRRHGPLESPRGTLRALLYALLYGLVAGAFMRVLAPALLLGERDPWLLATGDVLSVTLGLFVWVMLIAEDRPLPSLGFRSAPAGRLFLALVMGAGAAIYYAATPYHALLAGHAGLTPDAVVFSLLFAVAASALPEEVLFRGYLMGSLNGRTSRPVRIVLPALAFTAVRAVRFLPGQDLGLAEWAGYLGAVVLPLGLWWGVMRDLAGGSLWPGLLSHSLIECIHLLAGTSPATSQP
jgi:membrane protease YdiL (CAAX protease family)